MIKHTPNFRRWVNRLAIISLSIGTLSMVLIFFSISNQQKNNKVSCEEWISTRIEPLEFGSEITEIRMESKPTCSARIQLSSEKPNYIEVCECPNEKNLLGWVAKGDSLFKKSGERTLYVKKNAKEKRAFPYPCCE